MITNYKSESQEICQKCGFKYKKIEIVLEIYDRRIQNVPAMACACGTMQSVDFDYINGEFERW